MRVEDEVQRSVDARKRRERVAPDRAPRSRAPDVTAGRYGRGGHYRFPSWFERRRCRAAFVVDGLVHGHGERLRAQRREQLREVLADAVAKLGLLLGQRAVRVLLLGERGVRDGGVRDAGRKPHELRARAARVRCEPVDPLYVGGGCAEGHRELPRVVGPVVVVGHEFVVSAWRVALTTGRLMDKPADD